MPAGDLALFSILVGTGEVGGSGREMRFYLFQTMTGREQLCYKTIAQSLVQGNSPDHPEGL